MSLPRPQAQVVEAREQEPAAQVFLAACKSDLVERPQQAQRGHGGSAAPPAEGLPGTGSGSPAQSLGVSVEVEHWPSLSRLQQEEEEQEPQQQVQQQQQDERQAAAKAAAERGGGRGRVGHPAEPATPIRAAEEWPQSPTGFAAGGPAAPPAAAPAAPAAPEAAQEGARGGQEAAAAQRARSSPRLRFAAEDATAAAAAAAEVGVPLAGRSLPSPFAVAAAGQLQPAAPSPGRGSASVRSGGRGGAPSAASTPRTGAPLGAEEWEALSERASSRRTPSERGSSESPTGERRTPSPRPLPPPAVPQAAVDQYSASTGASVLWTSARTGGCWQCPGRGPAGCLAGWQGLLAAWKVDLVRGFKRTAARWRFLPVARTACCCMAASATLPAVSCSC